MTQLMILLATTAALWQSGSAPAELPASPDMAAQPVAAQQATDPLDESDTGLLAREPQRPRALELSRVEAYLGALGTLQARFTQIGADGRATSGDLFLSRPGRVRFDYDDPSPILLVADGSTVALADTALETVDRVPIGQTPLKWILDEQLDLTASDAVTEISRVDGSVYLTLVDPEGENDGRLTLVFTDADPDLPASDMMLAGWYAVDALGGFTEVTLQDVTRDVRLDPRLFILDDAPTGDSRRGRR